MNKFYGSRNHHSFREETFLLYSYHFFLFSFLVSYVEERPWWPIQIPNKGRKKKAKGEEEKEIRSSLLILDLKDGNL